MPLLVLILFKKPCLLRFTKLMKKKIQTFSRRKPRKFENTLISLLQSNIDDEE